MGVGSFVGEELSFGEFGIVLKMAKRAGLFSVLKWSLLFAEGCRWG
jgi:hypothetical protein